MYSYEERMKAVQLYIESGCNETLVYNTLGYPSPNALRQWYREYKQADMLPPKMNKQGIYSRVHISNKADCMSCGFGGLRKTAIPACIFYSFSVRSSLLFPLSRFKQIFCNFSVSISGKIGPVSPTCKGEYANRDGITELKMPCSGIISWYFLTTQLLPFKNQFLCQITCKPLHISCNWHIIQVAIKEMILWLRRIPLISASAWIRI